MSSSTSNTSIVSSITDEPLIAQSEPHDLETEFEDDLVTLALADPEAVSVNGSSDDADDDEEVFELPVRLAPIKYVTVHNAKIQMATWLVSNNRVKHDLAFHCYNILDQNNTPFQVTLLPIPKCSCNDKSLCYHILAVNKVNEMDITRQYKTPNMSQILKASINNKSTGRKHKGHAVNSVNKVVPASDSASQNDTQLTNLLVNPRPVKEYLCQLVVLEDLVDDYLATDRKFDVDDLNILFDHLSEIFFEEVDFNSLLKVGST